MDPHRQGLIQAHLAVFLFGASALFAKTLSVSPEVLVCIRTLFAASTLGLLAFVNKESLRIPFRTLMRLALLGMCLLVHWWTFFYSIQISSVAIGLLGFSSFPVFVLLLEGGLLRKPLRQADFFLVLLSIGGLLLVVPEYSIRGQTFEGLSVLARTRFPHRIKL